MPIIRLGGGVLDARGSVGGQTIRKGRSGHLLQSRRGPLKRKSNRQARSHSIFQRLTQYWSNNLTQAQRDQWKRYADAILRKNRLGQSVHLTGFHHFLAANTLLLQFGSDIHADGPERLTLPKLDPTMTGQFNFVTQKIIVFFDETAEWVNNVHGHMYVTMSQPHCSGKTNFNKSFRLTGQVHGSDVTPPTSPQTFDAAFPVSNGNKFVLKARIAEDHGRLSDFFRSTFDGRSCACA